MSIEHHEPGLVILFEHPEWQEPLFHAHEGRRVTYEAFGLKAAAFGTDELPRAPLYFNQASPSAYVRGNVRAVPFALALMEQLESRGARVLNGSRAFRRAQQARTDLADARAGGAPPENAGVQ